MLPMFQYAHQYDTFFAKATGRTVRQIWTNKGSKRVVPLKEVPFGGLNDVPLNFGGKIPKNWNFWAMNRTFKPEREKKFKSL